MTVHAVGLYLFCFFYSFKHRQSVNQSFQSKMLCNEIMWAAILQRLWLLTSVFLFTRCPNQLETSLLSAKPLKSSQQTVHSVSSWLIFLLCFLPFTLFLYHNFLFNISVMFHWSRRKIDIRPVLYVRSLISDPLYNNI